MKLSVLLTCILSVNLMASVYSQNKKFDIEVKDQSVRDILKIIENDSQFRFFYNDEFTDLDKKLSFSVSNQSIEGLLSLVLNDAEVSFKVLENDFIVITPKSLLQQRVITGKVTDGATASPLPGVTVMIAGTTNGVLTGVDGSYSIEATDKDASLIFSFIGYNTQTVAILGRQVIDVAMQVSVQSLDEVVVIGYGTVKRRDLTGAVSSIKSSEITKLATNNPLQSLQGKIAGMDIMRTSGSTGSGMMLNLRGNRSITASNSPMFLVDGIEYGSTLDINASDIASIDVLKDASSTAIYGSRGANGVVIITTKRGLAAAGKSKISINSFVSFNSPTFIPEKMNVEQEYRLMAEQQRYAAEAATGNWGSTSLSEYPADKVLSDIVSPPYEKSIYQIYKEGGVNLYDLMLHNSISQNHEISLSGGDAKTSFSVSLGYLDENGLLKNDNLNRYNGRITLDHNISKKLKTGVNLLFTYRNWDRRDDGMYYYMTSFYALSQPYYSDGTLMPYPSELGKSYCNPLFNEVPGYYKNNLRSSRIFANMFLEWQIAKSLRFKSVFGIDSENGREGLYEDYMIASHFQRSIGSSFSVDNSTDRNYYNENTLNYSLSVGKNDIQLLAGQTSDYYVHELHGVSGIGIFDHYLKSSFYDLTNIPTTGRNLTDSYIKTTKLSYFGRVNYRLMDRYLLTATIRGDGASVLAEGHKWAYFPSLAAAWVLKEEPILKDVDLLSNLKMRLSWGKSGNSAIGAYKTLTVLGTFKVPYMFGSDIVYGQLPANLGNEDLSWETTATWDAGLDISVLKDRINATFDYYYSNTYDLLLYRGLPATSVFPQVLENIGNTRNVGFEAALNFRVIENPNFRWVSDLTFSTNKDKIISLASGQTKDVSIPTSALIVGEPVQAFYDYEANGTWRIDEAAEAALYNKVPGMVKMVDLNNDTLINDLDKRLYNKSPKFIVGWSNSFSYKNITLSATTYARVGQWMRYGLNTLYLPTEPGSGPVLDYWTPENQDAKFPRPGIVSSLDLPALAYEKASFVKVRDVMLSYSVPSTAISKLGINNLRIYGTLQNFFTFSNIHNYDPEANGSISDPLLKQVIFGINLDF